jgi:hypothetical protein
MTWAERGLLMVWRRPGVRQDHYKAIIRAASMIHIILTTIFYGNLIRKTDPVKMGAIIAIWRYGMEQGDEE